MPRSLRTVLSMIVLSAATVLVLATPVLAVDPSLLAALEARSIGPATMSGRVAAIEAVASDPTTIYVGAATGGLWKSLDGGYTFRPVFDDQDVASIGSVAVFQPAPDIVWVGTGEGNPRNSASVGNGVYRSLDGGTTWTHLGLDKTEKIHRVVLHPSDPDTAWVAALGTTWGENVERGVFKTTDGGATWEKVLYVDERTGAADLVMDPSNPHKLFAAMWEHRRWPWSFKSGGPGSGIFVTHDGGVTWKRLTPEDGLPEGDLGRIGLAVAASDPDVVYALVEAKGPNVLLRSDDGGESFEKRANAKDQSIGNRPFYYADLRVDPRDPNRVYSLASTVTMSADGGRTWETLVPFPGVHPDHHALWIDPNDPRHLLNGNDGGVYESRDHGKSWRFIRNLTLAQFYHVRVDLETPYNVYGGLQDNGSWKGPSEVWERGAIRNAHWRIVAFGDGFDTVPDPRDPMQGYAMSQEGFLVRWNLERGETKRIRPAPASADQQLTAPPSVEPLRFNWNAGIGIDPFDPDTIYFGSQFVHRSRDRGDTWEVISPDLTSDNPEWQKQAESGGLTLDVTGAENFTTILAIVPSPLEQGLIWVGTDDGRLHVTRDDGESWTSVEGNVPGVPAHTWVPHIEPSHFDAGEAFVVFDDHRRANWTTLVYKTSDYGATWTAIVDDDDVWGYALAIAQDPVERDLLFLGTEFGLWVSLDGGGEWFKWTHGVPTVSVMDLVVHPRAHDLVLGTHGRGVYIVDDISPLRTLDDEILDGPLHLFPISPARQHRRGFGIGGIAPGAADFSGANRRYGALVTVVLNQEGLPHPDEEKERQRKAEERRRKSAEKPEESAEAEEEGDVEKKGPKKDEKLEVRVTDAQGEVVRTFEEKAHLGLNRVVWDLRHDAFARPRDQRGGGGFFGGGGGPDVLPGTYTVTVRFGEHEASETVEVLADPRVDISRADREANDAARRRAGELQEVAVRAIDRLVSTRRDVEAILARVKAEKEKEKEERRKAGVDEDGEEDPQRKAVEDAAKELQKKSGELEKRLRTPPDTKGITDDQSAYSQLRGAERYLSSSWERPTPAQLQYLALAEAALEEVLPDVNAFFAEDVAAFRETVREAGVHFLPEEEPLAMPADE